MSPECVPLVLLLSHAQLLLDAVQQVGSLEATATPIAAHHDGAEAAHQRCRPVHVELLRHRLATRGPVTVGGNAACQVCSKAADPEVKFSPADITEVLYVHQQKQRIMQRFRKSCRFGDLQRQSCKVIGRNVRYKQHLPKPISAQRPKLGAVLTKVPYCSRRW